MQQQVPHQVFVLCLQQLLHCAHWLKLLFTTTTSFQLRAWTEIIIIQPQFCIQQQSSSAGSVQGCCYNKMSNPRDRQILNSVINPLLPLGEGVYDDEKQIPEDLKDDEEEDTADSRKSRDLERSAISACESGQLDKSISLLTEAISLAPSRPSGYNNRAQVHRLQGNTEAAMSDLDKAIELGKGKGRSACQAFCQRGLLHRRFGRDEEASEDFKRAAALGSEYAKSLLVQLNPYAAMCNQMLKNVFQALEEGREDVVNPFRNTERAETKG